MPPHVHTVCPEGLTDAEKIEWLKNDIADLRKKLDAEIALLLTHPEIREMIREAGAGDILLPEDENPMDLLAQCEAHELRHQEALYRICAGITAFPAHDPDPNAVDNGSILGLRFEVMSRGKFLRPYYVLLNKPYPEKPDFLRVHRHTVPPCIPLAGFAARYLPAPGKRREQDLQQFARSLRRQIVSYHNRLGVVADLRKAAKLANYDDEDDDTAVEEGDGAEKEKQKDNEEDDEDEYEDLDENDNPIPKLQLVNIAPADAEAKHISFEWSDGRTGRMVMNDLGEIVKMVAVGDKGRDRKVVRDLLGGAKTVQEVIQRLLQGKGK